MCNKSKNSMGREGGGRICMARIRYIECCSNWILEFFCKKRERWGERKERNEGRKEEEAGLDSILLISFFPTQLVGDFSTRLSLRWARQDKAR